MIDNLSVGPHLCTWQDFHTVFMTLSHVIMSIWVQLCVLCVLLSLPWHCHPDLCLCSLFLVAGGVCRMDGKLDLRNTFQKVPTSVHLLLGSQPDNRWSLTLVKIAAHSGCRSKRSVIFLLMSGVTLFLLYFNRGNLSSVAGVVILFCAMLVTTKNW